MSDQKFTLFSFSGKTRILHLTWTAFFISFMVWFNHAPLMAIIRETFGLSNQEVSILLIMNVALTIPARIAVGMLVDRFGPRRMFSGLLVLSGIFCIPFAMAENFQQLAIARFMLGFVGAGFVIGIRMIGEWFPAKQTGTAQGVYGGWGNFGSAASAIILPVLALWIGGENGWRYAILTTAVIAIFYGIFYYFSVTDTPKGSTYFKPKKMGAMEVTSKADLILYLIMSIPVYAALALLVWKLSPSSMNWLSANTSNALYIIIMAIYGSQAWKIIQINKNLMTEETPNIFQFSFKQVALLDLAYMVTFGSELALVSMLPLFYMDTFHLSLVTAGILAAIYPCMNLIARPAGGILSDKIGRKRSLIILFTGISFTFVMLGQVSADWAVVLVVANTILCGLFSKGGSGAVYAMVPLIQRRMTGQIAGMTGAYGNVGGLIFLTVLSLTTPQEFFITIGITAAAVLLFIIVFLDEPKGQTAEILDDGTVQLIDVS
ncbi:MAG: NarK family nitrate/nitrite MFS transporter [Methylococcales bacterium]|nr:NarK family nitrate/nitrite MFS transporter [Methylococcales bacterium]